METGGFFLKNKRMQICIYENRTLYLYQVKHLNSTTMEAIIKRAFKFNTLQSANSFASRCDKLHIVILGENGIFWVSSFKDAQKLVKAGYEMA